VMDLTDREACCTELRLSEGGCEPHFIDFESRVNQQTCELHKDHKVLVRELVAVEKAREAVLLLGSDLRHSHG